MRTTTLLCLLVSLVNVKLSAQTRLYFSLASNTTTEFTAGPNLGLGLNNNSFSVGSFEEEKTFGKYLRADLNFEKRLYGTLYWVSGLSFHQTGYKYRFQGNTTFFTSDLKSSFLSVPLLLRFNYQNKHMAYLDIGLAVNYLVNADLRESVNQTAAYAAAHDNIASHLSRFSTSFYWQVSLVINRFVVAVYAAEKASGSSKDFSREWGLERDQSYYLLYFRDYHFKSQGVKISYRIK